MPGENFSFNLQTFLQDMREEQNEQHESTRAEVQRAFSYIAKQDTKIALIEERQATTRKILFAVFVAILGPVIGFVGSMIKAIFARG